MKKIKTCHGKSTVKVLLISSHTVVCRQLNVIKRRDRDEMSVFRLTAAVRRCGDGKSKKGKRGEQCVEINADDLKRRRHTVC